MDFLHPAVDGPARLRALLEAPEPLLAAGAYDGLSARLVEAAGFAAVYMTGFGTAASLLGRPDVGLVTATEMVGNAGRIVDAVAVPVVADADTGYGNPINVVRTVSAYERAGVAAIHLEDQVMPKKCGHMAGKLVVPAEDHVAKLRAAVAARTNPDFVLIARTDARANEGIDAAIERAKRYADAGADLLFVEAPQSLAEIELVATELSGYPPLLFNWAEGGKTPPVDLATLGDLGYRVVIFPVATLLTAANAITATLASIRATGTPQLAMEQGQLMGFSAFLDFIGLPEVYALEQQFQS